MGKQSLKKRMNSLQARIWEHQQKILQERAEAKPDEGLIHHWQREIAAFELSLTRTEKRLKP